MTKKAINVKETSFAQAINISAIASSKNLARQMRQNMQSRTVITPRKLNQVSRAYKNSRKKGPN